MTTKPGYVWDEAASEFVGIGQAAVLAPIAYQASQPSSPATGDIWIDSDDDVPSVDSTLYYRWTKTMSGGETSLSGNDNNSLSLQYTPGYESVFINGVLQVRNLDYTATSGSTISGLTALASNDIVMVESIVAYSVGDTYTQSQMTSLLDAKSPVSTTGMVLLSTSTIGTAVSSVNVTNAFNATYDAYKIVITGGVGSQTSSLGLKLGTTATGYYSGTAFAQYSAGAAGTRFNNNSVSWALLGVFTTNAISFNVELQNPFLTKHTYVNFWYNFPETNGDGGAGSGFLNNSTSYTDFTITTVAGTLTGGTIKVYGYK